jgi:hypothetical protein
MISAPNHRRQLNGNKLIAVLLLWLTLSCNAFKVISKGNDGSKPSDGDEMLDTTSKSIVIEEEEIDVDPEPIDNEMRTVYFHGDKFQVAPSKDKFQIALILPFFNNKVGNQSRTGDIMVEYYQGVQLAIKDLEMNGLKAKLFVYDDENDSTKLKSILSNLPAGIDFIIGPISERHMQIVSEFAIPKRIGVLSPFSPVTELQHPNTRFYSTAPSAQERANCVVSYMKKYHPTRQIIVLRDGSGLDKDVTPQLKALCRMNSVRYREIEYREITNWEELPSLIDTTVFYLPTHSPYVVSSVLGRLYSTKKDIIVVGENSWSNFQDNDYNFWNKLNIHLLATDFIDQDNYEVKMFKQSFREVNKLDPSVYSFLGYDQVKFVGDFLMTFGEHYPLYLNNRSFSYLASTYLFSSSNGFNANKHVYMLRFKNYRLTPVETD